MVLPFHLYFQTFFHLRDLTVHFYTHKEMIGPAIFPMTSIFIYMLQAFKWKAVEVSNLQGVVT
jgi:hypothetical protein